MARGSIVTICAFVGVGLLIGLLLAFAQTSGWLQHWDALPPAPESPVRILAANYQDVQIETASGRMYDCYVDRGEACWRESDTRQLSAPLEPDCSPRRPPTPFQNASDLVVTCEIGDPHYRFASYVIRADGRMFVWRDTSAEMPLAPFVIYPAVAAPMSLLLGLGFLFISWFSRVTTTGRLTTR